MSRSRPWQIGAVASLFAFSACADGSWQPSATESIDPQWRQAASDCVLRSVGVSQPAQADGVVFLRVDGGDHSRLIVAIDQANKCVAIKESVPALPDPLPADFVRTTAVAAAGQQGLLVEAGEAITVIELRSGTAGVMVSRTVRDGTATLAARSGQLLVALAGEEVLFAAPVLPPGVEVTPTTGANAREAAESLFACAVAPAVDGLCGQLDSVLSELDNARLVSSEATFYGARLNLHADQGCPWIGVYSTEESGDSDAVAFEYHFASC